MTWWPIKEDKKSMMEKMMVSELMRPIDEFPSISSQATFLEAVETLEKADQEFKSGKSP